MNNYNKNNKFKMKLQFKINLFKIFQMKHNLKTILKIKNK